MRLHLILMIGFILLQSCSLAQRGMYSSKSKKAIKYYESARTCFNTIDPISGLPGLECALDYVLKAIRKDSNFTEAYSLASNIFIEKSDIQRAIFYREKMIAKSNRVPSVEYYYLASMYMATGQYLKCKSYAQKFLNQINSNEVLVQKCLKFIKDCDFALKALATPSEFNPINMGAAINTDRPEYFPSITADDSTFLFTRRVIDANAPWGDEQEDIYVSFKQKGYWTNSTLISDQINSFFNEGAPTFSADGKYVIFVGCETGNRGDYEYGGNRKGYGSCDLFASEKVGDKWTKPFNLGPTINSRHWETQPSFSSDGKTLYFIRGLTFDRQVRNPKNQDIYFSELSEEGSWSKPQKLNNNIVILSEVVSGLLKKDNKEGYDLNSPLNFAHLLEGDYLLIHGSADDNVHLQNTMRMVEELIQEDKQFEWMIYPDKNHGIYGGNTSIHLYNKMTNFIENNL